MDSKILLLFETWGDNSDQAAFFWDGQTCASRKSLCLSTALLMQDRSLHVSMLLNMFCPQLQLEWKSNHALEGFRMWVPGIIWDSHCSRLWEVFFRTTNAALLAKMTIMIIIVRFAKLFCLAPEWDPNCPVTVYPYHLAFWLMVSYDGFLIYGTRRTRQLR